MKLRYSPGVLRPQTPGGGRVIDFKWPGRSPPKKILATPLLTLPSQEDISEHFHFCESFNSDFRY